MSKVLFFLQEGLRALRRSASPSIAAVVTVVVTVMLLGVLIPLLQATHGKNDEIRDQLELKAFLYGDATSTETDALQTRIEALPHVSSVEYVDKAEALAIMEKRMGPDITDELRQNPFPASFSIKPDNASNLEAVRSELTPPDSSGKPAPISPIISDVADGRDEAAQIRTVTSAVQIILIVITLLLLIASLMLVGNTIRLSIYARRREVEVMRLVGATNWFIRWPFMVEGLAVGFIGGLIAVTVLFAGKVTIADPLSEKFNFLSAQSTIGFVPLILVLLGSAMLVSAIGSGITLRRFLRV